MPSSDRFSRLVLPLLVFILTSGVGHAASVINPTLTLTCMSFDNSQSFAVSGGYAGNVYRIESAGEGFYSGWDRCGYAYTVVEGNVVFTARIKTARVKQDTLPLRGTGFAYPKVGISVREYRDSTGPENGIRWWSGRSANLYWDHYYFDPKKPLAAPVSWLWREQWGHNQFNLYNDSKFWEGACSGITTRDGAWLRIEVTDKKIRYYVRQSSADTWKMVETIGKNRENACGSAPAGKAPQPHLYTNRLAVGLYVASGDPDPATKIWAEFDSISVEATDLNPPRREETPPAPLTQTGQGTVFAHRIVNPPLLCDMMGRDAHTQTNGVVAEGHYLEDRSTYWLRADGRGFYWGWDRGGYAYQLIKGNGMITARFKDASFFEKELWSDTFASGVDGKQFAPQYGLCAREYRKAQPFSATAPAPSSMGALACNSRSANIYCDHYQGTLNNQIINWLWRMEQGTLVACDQSGSIGGLEKTGTLYDGAATGFTTRNDLWFRLLVRDKKVRYYLRYGSTGTFTEVTPTNSRLNLYMKATANAPITPFLATDTIALGLFLGTGGGSVNGRKGCSTNGHKCENSMYRVPADILFDNVEIECDQPLFSYSGLPMSLQRRPGTAGRAKLHVVGRVLRVTGASLSDISSIRVYTCRGVLVASWDAGSLNGNSATLSRTLAPGRYVGVIRGVRGSGSPVPVLVR